MTARIQKANDLEERARQADRRVRAAVEERPLVALAVALGTGFVLGRLIARIG